MIHYAFFLSSTKGKGPRRTILHRQRGPSGVVSPRASVFSPVRLGSRCVRLCCGSSSGQIRIGFRDRCLPFSPLDTSRDLAKVDGVERLLSGGCGRGRDLVSGAPPGRTIEVVPPEQRLQVGLAPDHLDRVENLAEGNSFPDESLVEEVGIRVNPTDDGTVYRHTPPRGDPKRDLGARDSRLPLLQLLVKTRHPLSSLLMEISLNAQSEHSTSCQFIQNSSSVKLIKYCRIARLPKIW